MKLIQLNTWNGRLDRQLTKFLEEHKPDFLCLQEAISLEGDSAIFMPIQEIQKAVSLDYVVYAPTFSFRFMQRWAELGNCIISRFAIQKSEVIFTHQQHQKDFDFLKHKSSNMRNFVHASVNHKGQKLNILTHHGFWVHEHKKGNDETMRQMKIIGEYIDALEGAIILTGDFNLEPDALSLEEINKRLDNLSVAYGLKTTRNQLAGKSGVCDYIFVNDKVHVKHFEASEEIVSDHKALILEFDI